MKKIQCIILAVAMLMLSACNSAQAISHEPVFSEEIQETATVEATERASEETSSSVEQTTTATTLEEAIATEETVITDSASTEVTSEESTEASTSIVADIEPIYVTEFDTEDVGGMDVYNSFMVDGEINMSDVVGITGSYRDFRITDDYVYGQYDCGWCFAIYFSTPESRTSQEVPLFRVQSLAGDEEYVIYGVCDNYEVNVLGTDRSVPLFTLRSFLEFESQMVRSAPSGTCPFSSTLWTRVESVEPTTFWDVNG